MFLSLDLFGAFVSDTFVFSRRAATIFKHSCKAFINTLYVEPSGHRELKDFQGIAVLFFKENPSPLELFPNTLWVWFFPLLVLKVFMGACLTCWPHLHMLSFPSACDGWKWQCFGKLGIQCMICIVSVPLCCLTCKALSHKKTEESGFWHLNLSVIHTLFFHLPVFVCVLCNNVRGCVNMWSSGYAGKTVSDFIGLLSGNLLCSGQMLCSSAAGIKVSLSVCVSAESLGGEIRSCQRWSRCYSTSSHQCNPMLQPTYSISALETTRSKPRFVWCVLCVSVVWVFDEDQGWEWL